MHCNIADVLDLIRNGYIILNTALNSDQDFGDTNVVQCSLKPPLRSTRLHLFKLFGGRLEMILAVSLSRKSSGCLGNIWLSCELLESSPQVICHACELTKTTACTTITSCDRAKECATYKNSQCHHQNEHKLTKFTLISCFLLLYLKNL